MPSKILTISDFSVGKDRRKGRSVADANRLRQLKNGFVTRGKAIKKRWGTTKVAYLETNTAGLMAAGGVLHTFTGSASTTHANKTLPVRYKPIGASALNDATSGGTYSGSTSAFFTIIIDATGSPDTFSWRKDSGVLTAGVSITGGAQALSDSVTITFSATTGHTLKDRWTIRTLVLTPNQTVGSNVNAAVFADSGLNDLTTGGSYMGSGTPVYTVEIDGVVTGPISAFAEKFAGAFTVMAALNSGNMTAMANAGGGFTTITSAGHGLSNEAIVAQLGSTSYNGAFTISSVTTNTYNVPVVFVANDATGTWKNKTTMTSGSHGLSNGNGVFIAGTTSYNGTFSSIESVATNTFVINTPFVADDGTGTWIITPASGTTIVTDTSHGRTNGQALVIAGTTSYNGPVTVANTTSNTFAIAKSFVANDATGTWQLSPNTFKWKKDAGSYTTGVSMTTALQTLGEGVQVSWGALTGHTNTDVWTIQIASSVTVTKVHFSDVFNGFIYVALEYSNGNITHHYLDGTSPTRIVDTNCPNSKGVIKMQEKIFAINGDVVDFSATGDPRDWTASSDAGFLAVGLHQAGNDNSLALGQYQKTDMVVFFVDGSQIWTVDPDPANHALSQILPGAQCRYHRSISSLFQDLFFLSDAGPQSIAENALTSSQSEQDVGSPLEQDFEDLLPIVPTDNPLSLFFREAGQYWLINGDIAYVYTLSKTSKIAAWGIYQFPWDIDDAAELDGLLYFRSGRNIYLFDRDVYTDAGDTVGAATQTVGSGLNDITSGGTFTSEPDAVFTIEITATGSPNTIKWKKDSGSYTTGVSITGSAQALSNGVTVTFAATTGHTLGNAWTVDTGHVAFEFEAEWPFLDADLPAVAKMWGGLDFVGTGGARFSFLYDALNPANVTSEVTLTGDTQPGPLSPIELCSVGIAPIIKNSANEKFQVDRFSMLYDALGPI